MVDGSTGVETFDGDGVGGKCLWFALSGLYQILCAALCV